MFESTRLKQFLVAAAVLLAGYGYTLFGAKPVPAPVEPKETVQRQDQVRSQDNSAAVIIAKAFANRESNVQVSGEGIVARILPDDRSGSRHQRFILRLANGQTLLVAHNIDLAPKVEALAAGDTVTFNGEYEWGPKGGTLHWTHHDPGGSHPGGWIEFRGRRYQ
ncbi:MAG: DUF3465 domain-containing protein [Chlorobiaceae bacterium]|nr:DUF3465 domain-containing protein [Chlorobiaceae bacterium]